MKRLFTRIAIAAASAAALFVALSAVAWALVDVDALVQEQVDQLKPEIERQLGRKVEIGAISTRFFPTLGARIEGIRVAGAAEGDAPLLVVGSAGFDLDLWGALLSLGKEVSLDAIYLDGLRVELVRNADGSLSIDDILALHPAEEAAPAEEESTGLDPAVVELLQRISVDEIRLAGAEIHLLDRAAPGGRPVESVVRQLDLRVRDLRLGAPVSVRLQAAAFAEKRNVDLQATVGPIPADLKIDGLPPLADVRAKIDGVDLSPLLPYLPLEMRSAVVAADFTAPEVGPAAPAPIRGFVAVKNLQFEGGDAIDVRLDADLVADLRQVGATIDRLRLQVGTVELEASGAVRNLATEPRFENFLVKSRNLDPQVLLGAFPMARASLPEGAKIAGNAALEMRASGTAENQSLNLAVDLGALEILLPGVFAKPAATPFALRVEGDFTPSSAALRKANLRLDELDLDLTGSVRDFAAPTYDFTLAAKPFSVDRLVRLLPEATARLEEANTRAAGKGALSGHLKGSPGKLSANLALNFTDVDVSLPDTTVRGALKTRLYAAGDPATRVQAGLRVDAGDSVIKIPGLIQKEAATPFVIDVRADKRGERIAFEKFDVRLAELHLEGRGALGADDATLALTLHPLDLERFARTIPAIPAERVADGRVEGALKVAGNPAQPETMQLALERFDLRLGRSDLHATATVADLSAPKIRAQARSNFLDLDQLVPPTEVADEGSGAAATRSEDMPALRSIDLLASFDATRIRLRGRDLERFRGRLVMRDGVLTVEEGTFGLYGGTVSANGTRAEVWRGQMPFHARLAVKQIDADKLVSGEFDLPGLLSGRGDLDVELDGVGFDFEALEQHLTGGWSLALSNGRLSTGSITSSVLGGLADVPGFDRKRLASEGELRDLLAAFRVEKGRMNLEKPIRLRLDGSRVELGGAVGIGGDLFLDGTYHVSPALVSTVTGGKCRLNEEAAVPLRIGGSAAKPSIQPDTAALATLVAQSCLAEKAQQAVSKLLGPAGEEKTQAAQQKIEEAKAEAQQKVEAARAEAQRKADEAKAEAERRAREAEEKAKKKAEEAGSKLRKSLGF